MVMVILPFEGNTPLNQRKMQHIAADEALNYIYASCTPNNSKHDWIVVDPTQFTLNIYFKIFIFFGLSNIIRILSSTMR